MDISINSPLCVASDTHGLKPNRPLTRAVEFRHDNTLPFAKHHIAVRDLQLTEIAQFMEAV